MKPRKKLIEEAKADGTLDKCDRLISSAFLLFVIAQDFYDEAGEKLSKHKLLLGEDKKAVQQEHRRDEQIYTRLCSNLLGWT